MKKPARVAERKVIYVTKKETIDPIVKEGPVEKIEAVAIKTADVKVEPAVDPVVSTSKQFYLIAGTFKGSKQANVLLKDLKEKGYAEALIIDADKYSKKFKVSVGGFENESDAYKANAKLKKVIGGEGWVYKSR